MTDLLTRTKIFLETRDSLYSAQNSLSDCREWLNSDWSPTSAALTPRQAAARTEIRRLVTKARGLIDDALEEARTAAKETPDTDRRPLP